MEIFNTLLSGFRFFCRKWTFLNYWLMSDLTRVLGGEKVLGVEAGLVREAELKVTV